MLGGEGPIAQPRSYYSARKGIDPRVKAFDIDQLRRLVKSAYIDLVERDCFQQAMGYYCVDAGDVAGEMGSDIDAYILRRLKKANMWPMTDRIDEYTEEDIFDMIELLHDHVSKPVDGRYHDFSGCGWHYSTFDRPAGQESFRMELNYILPSYDTGYELSTEGEVLHLADTGLQPLLEAELPSTDPRNVDDRVAAAILKFRRHGASLGDRRDSVRSLADVLEFLRPQIKTVLTSKDEGDLFNIANNFGIRHHNETQKTDYDEAIWLSWMFYFYLSTVHVVTRRLSSS